MTQAVFYVRDRDLRQVRQLRTVKDDITTVTVDFSAWAEDNGAVTSATWTVKNGSATVASEALSSNVATAVVTTAQSGGSLIEVKGAGATNAKHFNLRVLAKDPFVVPAYDYGYYRRV